MLYAPKSRTFGAGSLIACVAGLLLLVVVPAQAQTQYYLAAAPSSLNFTLEQGDTLWASISVYETNGGAVEFWTYNYSEWLYIDTGSVAPLVTPESLYIQIAAASLPPGVYTDSILIDTYNGANTPILVPVTLTVAGGNAEEIQVATNPSSLNLTLPDGQTHAEWVDIFEVHGAYVPFAVSNSRPWVLTSGYPNVPPYVTPLSLEVVIVLDTMPIGTYYDTLVISPLSDSLQFPVVRVPITVNITSTPPTGRLVVWPESFHLQLAEDESATQILVVYSVDGEPIDFAASNASSWLQLSPPEQLPRQTPDSLEFAVSSAGLSPGVYIDTILIESLSESFAYEAVKVPVEMDVTSNIPTLVAAPDHFDFTLSVGDSVLNAGLLVYDPDNYQIPFWVETRPGQSWLQVHYPDSLGEFWYTPDSVIFDVINEGMAAGTYYDTIVIFNPLDFGPGFADVLVPVTLTVTEETAPVIVMSLPTYFAYSLHEGESISDSLHVFEVHGRSVGFAHSNSRPWLVVNPFELPPLLTPVTMPVHVQLNSMPIGIYTDTIWITPTDSLAFFNPVAVPVYLSVSDSVPSDTLYCGDVDGNGFVNISDAVGLVNYIFLAAPAVGDICRYDCNGDGFANISDAVYLIHYVFSKRTTMNCSCQ